MSILARQSNDFDLKFVHTRLCKTLPLNRFSAQLVATLDKVLAGECVQALHVASALAAGAELLASSDDRQTEGAKRVMALLPNLQC